MKNNKYTLNVGNIGNIDYSNKKEAVKDFREYVEQSKSGKGRAANEAVTLFKGENILMEYAPENKLRSILDFDTCKRLVKEAEKNNESCVILCPNYSINISMRYDDGEELQNDLDSLSDYLGHLVQVSDFDDLIIDLSENED